MNVLVAHPTRTCATAWARCCASSARRSSRPGRPTRRCACAPGAAGRGPRRRVPRRGRRRRAAADIKCDPDLFSIALVVIDENMCAWRSPSTACAAGCTATSSPRSPTPSSWPRCARRPATKTLQDQLMDRSHQLERLAFTDPLTGVDNRRSTFRRLGGDDQRRPAPRPAARRRHDRHRPLQGGQRRARPRHGDAVLVTVASPARRAAAPRGRRRAPRGRGVPRAAAGHRRRTRRPPSPSRCAGRSPTAGERPRPGHPVTISVGWAVWRDESAEALVRRADEALYAAKAAGRNVVHAAD